MNDILMVGMCWGVVGLIVGVLIGSFIHAGGVSDPYEDDDEWWK